MTLLAGRSIANPWSAQPRYGLTAEYSTNPELATSGPASSEGRGAALLELPVFYDGDAVHFSLTPRVRYANSSGYSSVTSNYYHVDSALRVQSDLGQLMASGGLYRDSSLLYAGQIANGIGVRRDTAFGDLAWLHQLSERLQIQLEGNSSRTVYDQNLPSGSLVNYRYSSVTPTLSYALDERDTVKLTGGRGWYKSLDNVTLSNSSNVQLGFDRNLNEIWTLSLTAGFSRSTNTLHLGIYDLGASQNGTVYSATLTRKSERWTFSANASRALTPSGLAFLTHQDSGTVQISYTPRERWTFSGTGIYERLTDETFNGSTDRRFFNVDLAANYHFTETWVGSLHARSLGQKYGGPPAASATSNGVSLEISHQLYRTNL